MLFAEWAVGVPYAEGTVLRHGDGLYRVVQAHTSQGHQVPGGEGMLAIYAPVQLPAQDGGVLPWVSGEALDIGDRREYNGVVYEVYAPAGVNIWAPSDVPAIFRVVE